jgi:hypothetical protein
MSSNSPVSCGFIFSLNAGKIRTLICLMFLLFVFSSFYSSHPLKMTSMLVTYEPKQKQMEIEFRFFCDDFQNSLNKELDQRYNIIEFYGKKEVQQAVDKFISSFVKLSFNGKSISFVCNRSERNADMNTCSFFYTFPNTALSKNNNFTIENKLLLGYFPNQRNVVFLNFPGLGEKLIHFDNNYTKESITF